MKMIFNWTIGSFFRTIGKFFALLFIGLIALLIFGKINIKAYSFTDNGQPVDVLLPDSIKDYFAIVNGDGFSNNGVQYMLFTSDYNFTYVCNYYNVPALQRSTYCDAFTLMLPISRSDFDNIQLDTSYYKYYDEEEDQYYVFVSSGYFPVYTFGRYYNNYTWVGQGTFGVSHATSMLSSPSVDSYSCSINVNSSTGVSNCSKQLSPTNVNGYEVTFHLNGGTATYSPNDDFVGPPAIETGNFDRFFYSNVVLKEYIDRLKIKNDIAVFTAWYYDEELTQLYDPTITLNSNINLYASYEYTSVDSIISNVDFNEFTFPSDYQYAVISIKQDFAQGLYIGLGFNFQYLDVYNYNIQNQAFVNGSLMTLTSIGSKNNYYYYHMPQINDDESHVIVLDKANLIRLGVDNVTEHYYTFRLSSNAYFEFTNDLTQVSYYIPTGNGNSQKLENQDISANYDYTQKFILDSNSDIVTTFLSLIKQGNFNIFNIFKQLWYKFRAFKILNYFLVITIGAFIVALIKGGSRH